MGFFSILRKVLTGWYVVVPVLAALGIAAGALTFVYAFPGKPQIGVIDIPFTVLTEDSAYVIGEYINYARRDDSIKAVVIKLTTPGGGAAASEHLYIETRKLREEKPVVLVMNGLVASGGYMMAMGATHSYAKTSSLVGNVGVISSAGPLIPSLPDEEVVFSGPHKLEGASRRDWIGMVDQLKSAFAQIVISERGDRLRISRDELVEARLYSGVDAVRLGPGRRDWERQRCYPKGGGSGGNLQLQPRRCQPGSAGGIHPGATADPRTSGRQKRLHSGRCPRPACDGLRQGRPCLGNIPRGERQRRVRTPGLARTHALPAVGHRSGRPSAGVPHGHRPSEHLLPVRGTCSVNWHY